MTAARQEESEESSTAEVLQLPTAAGPAAHHDGDSPAAELRAARRAALAADLQLGRLREDLELAQARIAQLERNLVDLERAKEDELRSLRTALTTSSSAPEDSPASTDTDLRAELRRMRAAESQHSHITAALTRALAMARSEAATQSASEPATLRRQLAREREAAALLRELLTRSLADGQALQRELTGIRASRRYRLVHWIPTSERHRLPEPTDPTSVIPGVVPEHTVAILESGLWSREWYLQHNPDVVAAGVEPFRHFLTQGWRERRDPGPAFRLRERRPVAGEPADAPRRALIEQAQALTNGGSDHA